MFVNESEVIVRSIKNRFSSFDFFPKLGRSSENDQKPNQNKRQIRIEKILIRRSTLITQPHIRWVIFQLPAGKICQITHLHHGTMVETNKITFSIVALRYTLVQFCKTPSKRFPLRSSWNIHLVQSFHMKVQWRTIRYAHAKLCVRVVVRRRLAQSL